MKDGRASGDPGKGAASVGRYRSGVSSTRELGSIATVTRPGRGAAPLRQVHRGAGTGRSRIASLQLRLGHMPGPVQEAVAVGLARRRVLLEGVERLALIAP